MKLYTALLSVSLTILLTACGGSSGSKSNELPIASSSLAASSIASQAKSSLAASSSSAVSMSSLSSSSSSSMIATACATAQECEITNKALVKKIYTDVINNNQTDLIANIFAADVTLHIPGANNGVTAEIAHLQTLKNDTPNYIATIKHIAADGDYVAVHWHLSTTPANEFNGKAVIDLYQLANNKIVAHWYLAENLFTPTASGNSLFSDLYIYTGTKPVATQNSEALNKLIVTTAYLGLFNDKSLGMVDQYISPSYIQHNPYVVTGREAFRTFVTNRTAGGLSFFATVADDDLVWTFSGTGNLTSMDIFRVDNGILVEHYDVF